MKAKIFQINCPMRDPKNCNDTFLYVEGNGKFTHISCPQAVCLKSSPDIISCRSITIGGERLCIQINRHWKKRSES